MSMFITINTLMNEITDRYLNAPEAEPDEKAATHLNMTGGDEAVRGFLTPLQTIIHGRIALTEPLLLHHYLKEIVLVFRQSPPAALPRDRRIIKQRPVHVQWCAGTQKKRLRDWPKRMRLQTSRPK